MERLIRIVRESTICDYQNMTYKKCPKIMVVSSLEANITCINVFSKKSSSEIVLVKPNIDATNATLQPGSYLHGKIKQIITNATKTRIEAAITLRISNKCGGHYFISLKKGS